MSEVKSLSRRSFLRGSAAVAGVAGASLIGFQDYLQQALPSVRSFDSDVDVLNYALTLEHLEYAFYNEGLMMFTPDDFEYLKPLGIRRARRNLRVIREHELTHVETLIQVITSLGGTPVTPCTYDFGYSDVPSFLAVAQALENTGVMAYAGALKFISDPDLQTAAGTIATVEARHASYLNLMNSPKGNPFPDAFDQPKSQEEILAIAGQFIVSCDSPATTEVLPLVPLP